MKININAIMSTVAAATVLLGIGSAIPASAQFASFNQASNGTPFTFTNSGSASTFDAGPTNVVFSFLTPTSYGPANTNIDATMILTSEVSGKAANSGPIVTQGLNDIDVTFTAATPVNGKTNLLTLNMSSGTLVGINGGSTASLVGSTAIGNSVNYSSDFMSFGSNDNYNFPFSFVSSGFQVASDGYLKSFSASGNGSFTSNLNAVPETSGVLTVGMMILGTGLLCFMNRRGFSNVA